MKKLFLVLFIPIFFANQLKSQIVIRDSVFTTTLDLVGHTWDHAIIKNCTFQNTILCDGLRVANADHVLIDSCIFYNIQGNGIRLHPAGISNGIIISNCRFDSIYGNGILADEQHANTEILNNIFNWIGLDTQGASQGAPHHGIYFQGNNFLISGNRISNIYNNDGNCVSVRSNGIVRNNILSDATKNGISYFSDHPNVENQLLIENNIVYNCQRGVTIINGGEPYVDTTIIRFNTLVTDDLMCVSIGDGLTMNNQIYGNILVRTDDNSIFIWATSPIDSTKNLTSNSDVGFVDYLNHNYHITDQSVAYSYATGLLNFPTFDFENDIRESIRLDVGADQYKINSVGYFSNTSVQNIQVYPNPSNDVVHINVSDNNFDLRLVNIYGQNVFEGKNTVNIDVSQLPRGTYLLFIKTNTTAKKQKIIVY